MRKAYKRRPNDFMRRVIKIILSNRQDLLNEEHRYLQMIKSEELGKKYYNYTNFVVCVSVSGGSKFSALHKKKLSKAAKLRENKRKLNGTYTCGKDHFNYGRKHNKETLQIISSKLKGRQSPRKGVHLSQITKDRIAKKAIGRKQSEAFLNKIRKKICVDGEIYDSVLRASQQLPISYSTLNRRLKSEKYNNYYYIEEVNN